MLSNIRAKRWAVTFLLYYALWLHLQRRWLNAFHSMRLLWRGWRRWNIIGGSRTLPMQSTGTHSCCCANKEGHTLWVYMKERVHIECYAICSFDMQFTWIWTWWEGPLTTFIREATTTEYQLPSPAARYAINYFSHVSSLSKLFIIVDQNICINR